MILLCCCGEKCSAGECVYVIQQSKKRVLNCID